MHLPTGIQVAPLPPHHEADFMSGVAGVPLCCSSEALLLICDPWHHHLATHLYALIIFLEAIFK